MAQDIAKGRTGDIHNTSLFQWPDRVDKGDVIPESEALLVEETGAQIKSKIDAETKKATALEQEANIEYPGVKVIDDADANPSTPAIEIDEHGTYDPRLRKKATLLRTDISRLQAKYQKLVDDNITITKEKQTAEGLKAYASSISKETRTIANYLRSLKRSRRGRRAGKKGGEEFTRS